MFPHSVDLSSRGVRRPRGAPPIAVRHSRGSGQAGQLARLACIALALLAGCSASDDQYDYTPVTYHDGGPLPGAIEREIAIPQRAASPQAEEPARLELPEPMATGEDLAFVGELSTLPTDDVPAPILVLFVQRARDGKEVIHQNGIGMTERLRDGRVVYRVAMKAPATAGTFDVVISSRRMDAVICRGVAQVRPPATR